MLELELQVKERFVDVAEQALPTATPMVKRLQLVSDLFDAPEPQLEQTL